MTDTKALFRPFSLGSLELNNRIVMAPMTRSKSPGGIPPAIPGKLAAEGPRP